MNWIKNEKLKKELKQEMKLEILSIVECNSQFALCNGKSSFSSEEFSLKIIVSKELFNDETFKKDILLELEIQTGQKNGFINLVTYKRHNYLQNHLVIVYEPYLQKSLEQNLIYISSQGNHN